MVHILDKNVSIVNKFLAELRSTAIQEDRLRFRKNLERLGEVMAYEISKTLDFETVAIKTPMGISDIELPNSPIVLATILRAGLPLHQGLLNYFDDAGNAFISAYRKHEKDGTFEIQIEYISCPNLDNTTLIIADPMLATGASMRLAIEALAQYGQPKVVHIVTVIASAAGLDFIKRQFPKAQIWVASVDEELTAKSYIVPGLGDAGDLAYGPKLQD